MLENKMIDSYLFSLFLSDNSGDESSRLIIGGNFIQYYKLGIDKQYIQKD